MVTLLEIESLCAWFSRLVTILFALDCGLSDTLNNRALATTFISLHACFIFWIVEVVGL